MSNYNRPSFAELNTRINADLALIPAVLAEPLAAMWSRACHSQHGYLDWIAAQCSPLTCDLEHLYDWALLYKTDRLTAVAAQGTVLATGSAGYTVLSGSLLRAANGFDYQVLSAVTLGTSATAITVRCTTTGKSTNVLAGQSLTLIDPLIGVNNQMTVGVLGLTGGADDEDVDAWRLRVVDEWQTAVVYGGRSGKVADYKAWAKAAHPSITGALVQPHALGVGTVLVRPICGGLADRLPTESILLAVADYLPSVVPAVADYRVATPILRVIDIDIALGASADSADNRAAITTVIDALIQSKATELNTLLVTEIDEAVLSVTSDYVRVAPGATVTALAGEVFVGNLVFS
ncbi:baseplate J/gp47 family protein [Methylosoma difficile]